MLFYVHLCLVNFPDKCKIRHTSFEIYRIFENCPLGYKPKGHRLFQLSSLHFLGYYGNRDLLLVENVMLDLFEERAIMNIEDFCLVNMVSFQ